ncbi:hypothetical protein GQX74_015368 [Glossina fuscipes]|nr:hypothetical protein GQX74_015368 [Glossina fuscipes]
MKGEGGGELVWALIIYHIPSLTTTALARTCVLLLRSELFLFPSHIALEVEGLIMRYEEDNSISIIFDPVICWMCDTSGRFNECYRQRLFAKMASLIPIDNRMSSYLYPLSMRYKRFIHDLPPRTAE